MHHKLYELKEKLMDELNEYGSKDEMSAGDLEVVDKLTHTIKNLCKIIEDMDEEYSGRNYRMYDDGRSYAREYRNRGSYARVRTSRARDGRYSSYDDYMDRLNDLMNEAPDTRTRQEIERLMNKM